jgi:hypothetical protein
MEMDTKKAEIAKRFAIKTISSREDAASSMPQISVG